MKRELIIANKLNELSQSKFRSSFHLSKKLIKYIDQVGMKKIEEHTISFINNRLSKYNPDTDGKQTPMKNHPVFIAQHATACCCRGCIEKWHHIPKEKELNNNEKNFLFCLIIKWIENEYKKM